MIPVEGDLNFQTFFFFLLITTLLRFQHKSQVCFPVSPNEGNGELGKCDYVLFISSKNYVLRTFSE